MKPEEAYAKMQTCGNDPVAFFAAYEKYLEAAGAEPHERGMVHDAVAQLTTVMEQLDGVLDQIGQLQKRMDRLEDIADPDHSSNRC